MLLITANDRADTIVRQAQANPNERTMSALMDAISGIDGYRPANLGRQGRISRIIRRELARTPHLEDQADLISVFWEAVIKNLQIAMTMGSDVGDRQTKMNGIRWLEAQGAYAVRNHLNSRSRRMLVQVCNECGHFSKLQRRIEINTDCTYCDSMRTIVLEDRRGPDGNSKYRRCLDCGSRFTRTRARICQKCNSPDTQVIARAESIKLEELVGEARTPETDIGLSAEANEQQEIIDAIYAAIPRDPSDGARVTHAVRVLDVMVKPEVAADLCRRCKATDPEHADCELDQFEFGKCNYSKQIGKYINCAPVPTNRRVMRVREIAVSVLEKLAPTNHTAHGALVILKKRGKA